MTANIRIEVAPKTMKFFVKKYWGKGMFIKAGLAANGVNFGCYVAQEILNEVLAFDKPIEDKPCDGLEEVVNLLKAHPENIPEILEYLKTKTGETKTETETETDFGF